MKYLIYLFLVLIYSSCGQLAYRQTPQDFARFLEDFYQSEIKASPMTQTSLGMSTNKDKWDDESYSAYIEENRKDRETLNQLYWFDYNQLPKHLQLSYTILKSQIEMKLKFFPFYHHFYVMSHFRGDHNEIIPFLINFHTIKKEKDAWDYVHRLVNLEKRWAQINKRVIEMQEHGVTLPKWSYGPVLETFNNLLNPGESSLFLVDFYKKLDALNLDNKLTEKIKNEAKLALNENIIPSAQKLIETLKLLESQASMDDGIWKLPNGMEYYQLLLNKYTTTSMNYEQIHQLGLENVSRIHNEMKQIMKRVKFKGTLQDFFTFMRTDKQFFYENSLKGREKFLKDSREIAATMYEQLPKYFGILPKAPLVIKQVEAFREKSAGKAFYNAGSPDGSMPGIYYANLYDMSAMPGYSNEALIYHEGVPGHHMQISIAQELKDVPSFQKHGRFTAYTEGWGLYTEWLAKEMGFYKDPYSDFGRLAMELMRAIRLVVDTGIHAYKWSKEKAIDYFLENSSSSRGEVEGQILRYVVYPGQATAYLIGKIKLKEFYERAKKKNPAVDVRKFHDSVLDSGPMPLDVLEKKLQDLQFID